MEIIESKENKLIKSLKKLKQKTRQSPNDNCLVKILIFNSFHPGYYQEHHEGRIHLNRLLPYPYLNHPNRS